jgi:hypothetical protein
MTRRKEQSLADLYRQMPTAEIERRLERSDLVEVARRLAADELIRRRTAPPEPSPTVNMLDAEHEPGDRARFAKVIIGIALFAAAVWALLPKGLAVVLILGVSLPALATLIGKTAPGPSQIFGWVLLSTPVWLGTLMWHRGDLAWKSGDYRPLESIIMWGMLIVASLMGMGIGSSLIAGARHQGTWEDLEGELDRKTKAALSEARRLD